MFKKSRWKLRAARYPISLCSALGFSVSLQLIMRWKFGKKKKNNRGNALWVGFPIIG